ncbi:choice-of-anchor D domain-containing protein [Flavobacterium franklandianum]|uniref:choice-of-anchor D domain-containing protein n=1 Tax=Flavobacterium franklandianum TaxID=2594430 RepID=UPI00117BAFF6|nr:choice-of-anchor D domain-containing protein [Flavobacterium franklandianum]TRX29414.1 choice-of-anchor D domain-containing protein [Flavobacterium franklandianum]
MNKIILGFFLAKSKTTINGLLVLFAIVLMNTQVSWGQVNITPIRTDVSGFTNWTDAVVAGTTYVQLLQATSSTISPAMDFNSYTNETLNFKVRTFGGSTAAEIILTVWISIDNGTNWTSLGTRTPTSSTLSAQTAFDISAYSGTQVKIRFTVGGTSNSIGVGIDDISISGIVYSSGPEINVKGNAVSIVDGATPASITNATDFGTVATNTNVTKTYTIENTGSSDLVLTAPYVQKSLGTTVFAITQPVLTTIPTGSSTTFSVTFNSLTASTFDDVIEVLSNDSDEGVYNFAIKAIAQAPTPNISLKGNNTTIVVGDTTPSTADHTDFGNAANNTNVVKTYTIENTGTGNLTVNTILMNVGATKYTIGGISLPATVLAGGSTTFTLTFNSAVAGTFADTVNLNNDDPTDSTYTFGITAKAVALNFGVGDISITALSNDTPDGISFVNWVPIPVDAELIFTDNAWDGAALLVNEGTSLVWKNNTGNIVPVGTVIYINTLTASLSADFGSVTGALDGLSASGENLFMYEGSGVSPNFIYGLSNLAWLTTGTVTSNSSYLPTALNVTNGNIVTGDFDNVEYSGSLALKDEKSSFSAYKTLVNDPVNWTKNNTPFILNSLDFELAAVWETAAWNDALTPTASLKVVINDSYSTTTNGTFSAKKVTVKARGSLIINSGTNIVVQNEVINNGSLVVENNANLIQVNNVSNTGVITVKRNSNSLYRLDYTLWSSPVANQNLEDFSPLTSQSPSRFYTFDTTYNTGGIKGAYSAIETPTVTNFTAGTGYLIRMPNTEALTGYDAGTASLAYSGVFTGVPNNGDVPVTLSYIDAPRSYNSVGNPYSSVIDANTFITANTANIESTLYFWRKKNGSGTAYAAFNPLGGTLTYSSTASEVSNGKIQVGQGFFVQAKNAITVPAFFTNAMRETSPASTQFFKTKKVIAQDRIWLNLTNTTGVFSQSLLGYIVGATQGLDSYDGKYINDSPIALTSNINNEEYTIQGRPAFDTYDIVSLNFKTNVAGDYTIAIDHVDGLFATDQDIYLVDSKTGAETNLKTSSYNFTAVSGIDNTRFSLKYQKALRVDDSIFNENNVTVYSKNGILYLNSGEMVINTIQVYDVQGRLLAERKNVKATTTTLENLIANNQVLLVKVSGENNQVVVKKVVN